MNQDDQSAQACSHAEDYGRVREIIDGNPKAWDWFVAEYSNRILWAAYLWCRRSCRKPRCPVRRTGALGLIDRIAGASCDDLDEGFIFILSRIKDRILPFYRGRCSLSAFLFPVLNPLPGGSRGKTGAFFDFHKLHTDFVREQVPRVRPPRALQKLPERHQKVYVRMRWGWDDQRIAKGLSLDAEELPVIKEQIEATLQEKGWKSYWNALGPQQVRTVPLTSSGGSDTEEEGREFEVADRSPAPDYSVTIDECRTVLGLAIARFPVRERVLLRMKYGDKMTARQLAAAFQAQQREVFYWIESALLHLRAALVELLSSEHVGDLQALKDALEIYFDQVNLGVKSDSHE